MKYILIDKKTKRIKSISDGIIKYNKKIFELKKVKINQKNQDNIEKSEAIRFIKNKFQFEIPDDMAKQNKKQEIKNIIKNAKSTIELKNALLDLINLV